jgi:hypothetical protein
MTPDAKRDALIKIHQLVSTAQAGNALQICTLVAEMSRQVLKGDEKAGI